MALGSPFIALALLLSITVCVTAQSLPIVNLGYGCNSQERHQAISFNANHSTYNFSNIRYAAPPLGELRFAAPLPPTGNSSVINNGSVGAICPQATPLWSVISGEFVPAYLTGQPFNYSAAEAALANMSGTLPAQDPRTSEDCLFLDVVVPKKIFQSNGRKLAPVMVWIYGGGFTEGEKTEDGVYNPAGLITASQATGTAGIVYVAINYRLGAFGFLAGPTLQSNGTANAGLYDQRMALQWVQNNIHLFGGDKNKVTVFGESAGGASIMHQITAFGGLKGPAPFAQAIPQSPAWQVMPSSLQQETTFQTFLSLLNVSTIEEARQLPSEALIVANIKQVAVGPYGSFTYGPVVDGLFAPSLPGRLLLQGSFDKTVKVMVGHNADEGLIFTSPTVTNSATYDQFVLEEFPDVSPAILAEIDSTLYPPIFDGTYAYTSQFQRAVLTTSESTFTCNTNYLDRAFGNKTYSYQFSVGAALHGSDVPYTFYNGPNPSVLNNSIALALQRYLTSFAITGVPSGAGLPAFPMYGSNAQIINLNTTMINVITDPNDNPRCLFWQKALYF